MKKLGLIIANPDTNYGAHLQGFATQCVIDGLGFNTVIIDYRNIKTHSYYLDWGLFVFIFNNIFRKFISKKKKINIRDDQFIKNQKDRIVIAKDFRKRRLHDIKVYKKYADLVKDAYSLSGVLIGSDQMWLPGVSFGPILSLRFAPYGVSRISYATSLGVSSYPHHCWNSARDMWNHMNFLSVREEQGAKIIREVCGDDIDVKVVVDPTYLLTKEQWEEAIPIKKMCDKKYVFCYFLGEDIHAKQCARRFANKHKLYLVSILSCESYTDIDRTFADETIGAVSPEDFINWLRGAEYVFTDSFHGLAFSVINHKQFFVFYRVRNDVKLSRNSRIDNILKMWHCENRLVADADLDWDSTEVCEIDYMKVENIVSEKRNESLSYLKKALGVNEY